MTENFDLVVVGSGAAGMAAALTARHLGLSVLIVEKTRWIGGSTALSGGAVWMPNNHHQLAAGAEEPREQARDYLRAEVGNHGRPEMWSAFLDHGPQAIRFLEARTELKFSMRPFAPDYHPDQPGAALGHRVMDPLDFDGRQLGPDLARLRPPIPEFTVFGGMMVGRADIPQMFRLTRDPRAALHAARILTRHLVDRATHGRATRLVLGAAMAGRLLASCRKAGIELRTETAATQLLTAGGRVTGIEVTGPQGTQAIHAAHGVVLAGGGAARARLLAHHLHPHADRTGHWSMSPEGSTGDSLALAAPLGVEPVSGNAEPLFYAPVSLLPQPGGAPPRPFAHLFLDRAKPGVYAVDSTGRRFVNEAASYHDFVRAMLGRGPGRAPQGPVWLIADHQTIRRYGLGAVRPFPAPLGGHLRSGYLKRGQSLAELARAIDVPEQSLLETASHATQYAAAGHDPDHGKGATAYNRYLGDPENRPNPCLGPLARAPFYAIRLYPGDIGAAVGLPIDPQTRVLDRNGTAVPGLFACGNDANSIMGGTYPGAGITLGPALTFGYIAAHTAAGVRTEQTV